MGLLSIGDGWRGSSPRGVVGARGACWALVTLWHVAHTTVTYTSGVVEVCQWRSFNASCPPGEVIVVTEANYGRMRVGRCLSSDYGYLGCKAGAVPYVDSRCSGRRQCQLVLPDVYLDNMRRPCPTDLKAYLEVEYRCTRVETGSRQSCHGSGTIHLRAQNGYISNAITEETGKGSAACPWQIDALPGQTITLSLLDFAVWRGSVGGGNALLGAGSLSKPAERSGICHIYAEVKESTSLSGVTLCGGESKEKTVFISETNQVTVLMTSPKNVASTAYFLIKYVVNGCPDFEAGAGAVTSRRGDETEVTCVGQDKPNWVLRCDGHTWVGDVDNCTEPSTSGATWSIDNIIESTLSLPQGLLILLIIIIAILIAVIILAIGIISIKRRHGRDRVPTIPPEEEEGYSRQSSHYSPKYPMLAKHDRFPVERESTYTTTLHRRMAVPPPIPLPAVGEFPILPPPPQPVIAHAHNDAGPCPVHCAHVLDMVERQNSNMTTFRPAKAEHIYESPKFLRKDNGDSDQSGPFYHELDPDAVSVDTDDDFPPPPPPPNVVT